MTNKELEERARELEREYKRQWRAKNRDHIKAYNKQWRAENRERRLNYNLRYWMKKAQEEKDGHNES